MHEHADASDRLAELLLLHSARVERELRRITDILGDLMANIDDLITAVAAEKTADDSLIALVNSLEAQVAAALGTTVISPADQIKLDAVFAGATDNAAEVNAALAANTPAAPAKL